MRWEEMAVYLIIEAGLFLFGEVVLWIMVYVAGEKESIFPLGTVITLFIFGYLMFFLGMSSVPMHFNTAVSMGATRRRIVPAILCTSLVMYLAMAWFSFLLYHMEKWIFRIAYAGIPVEDDFGFLFRWKYILPACLVMIAVNVFMGALFLKVGKSAFVVFWLFWMLVFVGGPRLWHLMQSEQDNAFLRLCRGIAELFMGFSEMGILAAVAAASAGLIFVSWMMLRRQQAVI